MEHIHFKGKHTSAEVMIDHIDESCASQITKFINHPAFTNKIAIMPDTHAGKGSVIGFTMSINPNKVIPNVIGVDISCGMNMAIFDRNIFNEIDPLKLDEEIRKVIPFGQNVHESNRFAYKMRNFNWKKVKDTAVEFAQSYEKNFNKKIYHLIPDYNEKWLEEKCKQIGCSYDRALKSIGSLGGGNHFIEFGEDKENGIFAVTVHSGSRNFGKCICEYWQNQKNDLEEKKNAFNKRLNEIKKTLTKDQMKEMSKIINELKKEYNLEYVPKELDYLEGSAAIGYLFDMVFCQEYANSSRIHMIELINECILKLLSEKEPYKTSVSIKIVESIKSVHNYIDFKDMVIRKGAISSYRGQKMIIPFNMRDGILVCEGKSNPDWNFSAPHGAGRVLSRSEAKRQLSLDTFKDQMKDIASSSVNASTIDEAPDAYKDCKIIEEAIEPTAKILWRVKPILNLKANEDGRR